MLGLIINLAIQIKWANLQKRKLKYSSRWVAVLEGSSKKENELMDRDHSVVIIGGGVGGGGKGYKGDRW